MEKEVFIFLAQLHKSLQNTEQPITTLECNAVKLHFGEELKEIYSIFPHWEKDEEAKKSLIQDVNLSFKMDAFDLKEKLSSILEKPLFDHKPQSTYQAQNMAQSLKRSIAKIKQIEEIFPSNHYFTAGYIRTNLYRLKNNLEIELHILETDSKVERSNKEVRLTEWLIEIFNDEKKATEFVNKANLIIKGNEKNKKSKIAHLLADLGPKNIIYSPTMIADELNKCTTLGFSRADISNYKDKERKCSIFAQSSNNAT